MVSRIEGFLFDSAFVDRSKSTHGILTHNTNQIGTLSPTGLSYFVSPDTISDPRAPGTRTVSWTATTTPTLLVDSAVFGGFTDLVANFSQSQSTALFKIIDALAFTYGTSKTPSDIDKILLADPDIAAIYSSGSCTYATKTYAPSIYLDNGDAQPVTVPAFVQFDVSLTQGETPEAFTCVIYLSNDDWLADYTKSTIEAVIAPLPYDTLLNAPISTSTANIFTTANTVTSLAWTTSHTPLGTDSVSGNASFNVVLHDGTNTTNVIFQILYKGQAPTITEIRQAIRQEIENSGVGTQAQWKLRAPNLYITSRFYFLPLWDKTYTGLNKVFYAGITQIEDIKSLIQKGFSSAGLDADIDDMALLTSSYNRMQVLSVPDLTDIPDPTNPPTRRLVDLFPDFQTCSSIDADYALLKDTTQQLVAQLNMVLAQDNGVSQKNPVLLTTSGNLSYYSIVIEETEVCVVSKATYNAMKGTSV